MNTNIEIIDSCSQINTLIGLESDDCGSPTSRKRPLLFTGMQLIIQYNISLHSGNILKNRFLELGR